MFPRWADSKSHACNSSGFPGLLALLRSASKHPGGTVADEQPGNVHKGNDRIGFGIIVTAVILVVLAIFVAQNLDPTKVKFLFLSRTLPLWIVALIFLALGVVLGWIWRWFSRRRNRQ